MKRYYYHVSYYRSGKKSDGIGDCVVDTSEPIKTAETINTVRRLIAEDEDESVAILGFQLLRIEGVEPEEVITP